METGEVVVVSCSSPKEKFWGLLLGLTATGVTVRAVPVDACEDWLRQHAAGGPAMIGPVTIFLPAHRIERIEIEESSGAVECFADRFRRMTGRDPKDALLGGAAAVGEDPREM